MLSGLLGFAFLKGKVFDQQFKYPNRVCRTGGTASPNSGVNCGWRTAHTGRLAGGSFVTPAGSGACCPSAQTGSIHRPRNRERHLSARSTGGLDHVEEKI